jgi:hypothetical protein
VRRGSLLRGRHLGLHSCHGQHPVLWRRGALRTGQACVSMAWSLQADSKGGDLSSVATTSRFRVSEHLALHPMLLLAALLLGC